MSMAQVIQTLSIVILPLLFAVTLHEVAHAWMADRKGDPTARMLGRITLNPLAHIDPFGTVILPLMLIILPLLSGLSPGFLFGYAKPVPVNPFRLQRPKTDMAWVAVAGPAMNFALAFASGAAIRVLEFLYPLGGMSPLTPMFVVPLQRMLEFSVGINTLLMVFNMIPIPPLDGGRVLVGILPEKHSSILRSVEPFGMFLILFLVFADPFGLMRHVVGPVIHFFEGFFFGLAF